MSVSVKATVGSVVHFVDSDLNLHLPAFVVLEEKPLSSGRQVAGLSVHYPLVVNERGTFTAGVRYKPLVMQDEADKEPGTWHFPERDLP